MKRKILLAAASAGFLIACLFLLSDGPTYLIAAVMALIVMGVFRYYRSRMLQLTRWAKANPRKTQWTITGMELALMGSALLSGYNLQELGYAFSDSTAYVFGAIMAAGFLSIPFWPKRSLIALPSEVNRHRLAYLGIIMSSWVLMNVVGNRIEAVFPDSLVTQVIRTIDQAVFSDDGPDGTDLRPDALGYNSPASTDDSPARAVLTTQKTYDEEAPYRVILAASVMPNSSLKEATKAQKEEMRKARKELRKKYRKIATAGMCVLAVFLIIGLIGTICAGICLMTGAWGNAAGVGAVIGGVLIVAASIWAIIKVAKWCRKTPAPSS